MKPLLKQAMTRLAQRGAIVLMLLTPVAVADQADIEGRWLSGDKSGWIDIRMLDGNPVGTAAGSTTPDEPTRYDEFNPDSTLQDRPLLGITILHGFTYEGDGVWKGGTVYDPNSGNTYKSTMTLVDKNTLKVRGYIGVSLFGRSDTWTRDDL
jgi:uncharacterized protein (DUF2147 family)